MLADMTEQEKKEFVNNLNGFSGTMLKSQEKSILSNRITTAVCLPALVIVGIAMGTNLAIFLPIALTGGALIHITGWLSSRMAINRILKRCSGGKVSYKEYKKLKKSGELDKLMEQYTEVTTQVQGTTLSKEDIEALKKLISKKGLKKLDPVALQQLIEQTQKNKQTDTTSDVTDSATPEDDGRNA